MTRGTATANNELPFRIWQNLGRVFYSRRPDVQQIMSVIADNPQAIVYVRRHEDGDLSSDIALWAGEARALVSYLRSPSPVLQYKIRSNPEMVAVRIKDVFADTKLLEGLRDRLASLLLYDPKRLPKFPAWTWSFPSHSRCNLLIENGRLVAPPEWEATEGRFTQLDAPATGHAVIIDGDGKMGLMTDAGEVCIPCSFAYLSRPRHGDNLACEASVETIPEQGDACDLIDVRGKQLNPRGIKIRAGTLRHDIAVVHHGSGAGGLTAFMTSKGKLLGNRRWKDVRKFSDDLAAVQDPENALWGYIDKDGTLVVHPRFTRAQGFDRGYAVVATPESEDLLGLIDRNGTLVVEPVWRELKWLLGKYFLATDRESALGLIDNRGNVIIEPYYPTREEDAEISKARGSIRSHPFVRMLGAQLNEKVAAIEPGGSLAPLAGLFSPIGANDIELLAAGLWGCCVVVAEDYKTEFMRTPIAAGSTGSISWHYPVTASLFDLSKEAPVRGLPIMPHASIGVPWEVLRFGEENL